MSEDKSNVQVVETMTLKKFEGEDTTQEPIETVEITRVNGVEVSRVVKRKEVKDAIS